MSLDLNHTEVDSLKAEKGGEKDNIDVLIEWAECEEDIKSKLKNLHQSQSQMHQEVEDVRQAQKKLKLTKEDVRHTQHRTPQNVKEVAAGLKDIKETVASLKDGKDKDSTDEALRNLTKSEFMCYSPLVAQNAGFFGGKKGLKSSFN